jgi:hypothetical protein
LRVTGVATLFDGVTHIPRRIELPFLNVHRPSAQRRCDHQVGLATQKRRNLQNIRDLCNLAHIRGFVHIGQNRQTEFGFDLFQNPQAFFQSGPAKAANGSPVGLVVTGLENEREFQSSGDAFDDLGHSDRVLFALNHARTCNQEEFARADVNVADLEGSLH